MVVAYVRADKYSDEQYFLHFCCDSSFEKALTSQWCLRLLSYDRTSPVRTETMVPTVIFIILCSSLFLVAVTEVHL